MNEPAHPDARARVIAAIRNAAEAAFGDEIPAGTTVVASPDRAGSNLAVAYPFGDRTIVWCAPGPISVTLEPLNGPVALSNQEFRARIEQLGGVFVGAGHHRVLSSPAPDPQIEPLRLVALDRDDAADVALIAAFVEHCSADDLNEAEVAIDQLDEAIVGVLDGSGALAAYASARRWFFDASFDDVAVITHPAHRGHGLGTAAVAALSQRRQRSGRTMFYGCNVENHASGALAEAAGFELVHTVTAVSFG